MTTPTDDLAAVVSDEAERCGVDVRELARALLGWTVEEMENAAVTALAIRDRHRRTAMTAIRGVKADATWFDGATFFDAPHPPGRSGLVDAIAYALASPPAAPGGDESSGSTG